METHEHMGGLPERPGTHTITLNDYVSLDDQGSIDRMFGAAGLDGRADGFIEPDNPVHALIDLSAHTLGQVAGFSESEGVQQVARNVTAYALSVLQHYGLETDVLYVDDFVQDGEALPPEAVDAQARQYFAANPDVEKLVDRYLDRVDPAEAKTSAAKRLAAMIFIMSDTETDREVQEELLAAQMYQGSEAFSEALYYSEKFAELVSSVSFDGVEPELAGDRARSGNFGVVAWLGATAAASGGLRLARVNQATARVIDTSSAIRGAYFDYFQKSLQAAGRMYAASTSNHRKTSIY